MHPSIALGADERNDLLLLVRSATDPQLRLRAHIVLLLADGHAWSLITAVLFCSSRTIDTWQRRFRDGRLPALTGQPRGPRPRFAARWAALVCDWVTRLTPRAFGFWRSRWCCAVLALVLRWQHGVCVSRETVRRWLQRDDFVWRRPRPVLRRDDPEREARLAALRTLLHDLPDDETVVFQDEVDVNLNPEIGSMWMRRGQQAEVVTPGDNAKNYLAGSLHWRTGILLTTIGPRRNSELFVRHLDDLCYRLRRYRKIHVICDNAKFPDSKLVKQYLKGRENRIALHWLPRRAPECNPVERVWWHLREEITRNHTCRTLDELIDLVLGWLDDRKSFTVEDSVYNIEEAA